MVHHRRSSIMVSEAFSKETVSANFCVNNDIYSCNDNFYNNEVSTKQGQGQSVTTTTTEMSTTTATSTFLYQSYEHRTGKEKSKVHNGTSSNIYNQAKANCATNQVKRIIFDDNDDDNISDGTVVGQQKNNLSVITPLQRKRQQYRDNDNNNHLNRLEIIPEESEEELILLLSSTIDNRDDDTDESENDNCINEQRNGHNNTNYSSDNDNDDDCGDELIQVQLNNNNIETLNKKVRYMEMTETIQEYLCLLTNDDYAFDVNKVLPILITLYNMIVIHPTLNYPLCNNNNNSNAYRSIFIQLNGTLVMQQVQDYWILKNKYEYVQSDINCCTILQTIEQIIHSCIIIPK